MESSWTSKHAILRDLSVAQGREVPVEIQNTVTKNEKPPALNYTEETEEEFFENCVSNEDISTGPDITLIQQMLHMVRDINVTEVKEVDSDAVLEISKNHIHQGSGDGCQLPEIIKECVETKKKPKGKRNVAVASLLAAYGDKLENKSEAEIPKPLKPNSVSGNDNNKTEKKHTQKEKDIKAGMLPITMFKKKSVNQKTTECTLQQPNCSPISDKSECVSPMEPLKPANFVPSSQAGEYYKKYVERSELQATVKEDMWSRVERQMREIDIKSIKESTSPISIEESSKTAELHGTVIDSLSE